MSETLEKLSDMQLREKLVEMVAYDLVGRLNCER